MHWHSIGCRNLAAHFLLHGTSRLRLRPHGRHAAMTGDGTVEREPVRHRKGIDRTERDLARSEEPEEPGKRSVCDVDPVPPEDEHDRKPHHTSGEGPCHAAGALACVERRNAYE